ncbi:MAG: hypothetical protein K6G12_07145 [Lachnospiraceae bacterium]|nr:hypothetical protein [Lachnospiraceae bacterium]
MKIHIDKLYRYERKSEPCYIGFPLPKGKLTDTGSIKLYANEKALPLQSKVTSLYDDGSVRFIFLRFLTDIPANAPMTIDCDLRGAANPPVLRYNPLKLTRTDNGYTVITHTDDTGEEFSVAVNDFSDNVFENIKSFGQTFSKERFLGPLLTKNNLTGASESAESSLNLGKWEIAEEGPVCIILKNTGKHNLKDSNLSLDHEIRLTFTAGKPWIEVSYRIINTTPDPFTIGSLTFEIRREDEDHGLTQSPDTDIRSCVASSNYKTSYLTSDIGGTVSKTIDADWLIKEANEHFGEVFYGTFFADVTDSTGGICASLYQAHQNFPKALEASKEGIRIILVPQGAGEVTLQSGMAREQRFLLHFHKEDEPLESLNDRSIVYQMPYRPYVSPQVHRESGVWPEIFADSYDPLVEQNLTARADGHCRAYGMLNFGDSYDSNYTAQGRGGGRLVWCNNEYDYPHACALMFVRSGMRRFLDYNLVSCSHWMDVDVCHYHEDPMYIGGQWEHTAGHVINGVMVCSHEWVEGLLDYYHFSGDERGLETAIGIGENVKRLLDTPAYSKVGEANARETGWALRTLTALYTETLDKSWLVKCDRIVNDFKVWEETYGHWLAPYTDNTLIRVGFMICVAVGSLMRYYRVFPDPELKAMILRAVDDLVENCYVPEWGIFYYKELPSLNRLGNNTLLLEALTYAYDLSGDSRYLEYGLATFKNAISDSPGYTSSKRKEEDAVIVGNMSSKNFAQSMIPISGFYRALNESGIKLS